MLPNRPKHPTKSQASALVPAFERWPVVNGIEEATPKPLTTGRPHGPRRCGGPEHSVGYSKADYASLREQTQTVLFGFVLRRQMQTRSAGARYPYGVEMQSVEFEARPKPFVKEKN